MTPEQAKKHDEIHAMMVRICAHWDALANESKRQAGALEYLKQEARTTSTKLLELADRVAVLEAKVGGGE